MGLRQNLSRLRMQQGFTQEQLAAKLGVSGAYISMLEAGKKTNPSLGLVRKLARIFKVPIGDLLA